MTQTDLSAVMDGANNLMKNEVSELISSIKSELQDNGCSDDVIQTLNRHRDLFMKEDVFKSVRNQYLQIKFFKNNYGLIMPSKIILPVIEDGFVRKRTNQAQKLKKEHYFIVPMISQLEQLLNFGDLKNIIDAPKITSSGTYSCFEDGLNYKRSLLFQKYPTALQIHLYLDEVQICNPIGSYNHKLVFVYFSIGNVPRYLRSRFEMMHLLAIFYDHQVERYGYNVLLRPIVEDFKKLEAGVNMCINGKNEIIRGTLTAIVADNLACRGACTRTFFF